MTDLRPRPRWRRIALIGLPIVIVVSLFVAWRYARAYQAGVDGKAALINAQGAISPGNNAEARRQLLIAKAAFDRMQTQIDGLGPIAPVMRLVPFVRAQVKGVDAVLKAGHLLTEAGLQLNDAAERITAPDGNAASGGRILPQLAIIQKALSAGATKAVAADKAVHSLDGKRLLGPLNKVRNDLIKRLDPVADQATEAATGAKELQTFFGQNGPRRYLVFSQNPEEIRPTGGYLGAFSVMSTGSDGVKIEQTTPVEAWIAAHPDIRVPNDRLGGIFQYSPNSLPTLANTNFLPDWTIAGRLAADLWKRGGETPVDGVVGVTPGFLRELLQVTGPLEVPQYNETVSADNLIDRFAFHTRQVALNLEDNSVRKGFAGQTAAAVLNRALAEPQSKWKDIAIALGKGFDHREAMVWSPDASLAKSLHERDWDGTLPQGVGDFFYNAEFSFGAKNGRALKRSFDHHVVLHKDGSAVVTTTISVTNSTPRDRLNPTSMVYTIAYGPTGARLSNQSLNPVTPHEVSIAGHPGTGFFVDPGPFGTAKLKVVWTVPALATNLPGHDWSYDLRFMHIPDHTGDTVHMQVDLPPGWKWKGGHPPIDVPLDLDLVGSWKYGP